MESVFSPSIQPISEVIVKSLPKVAVATGEVL
jgi:hypothetical protein